MITEAIFGTNLPSSYTKQLCLSSLVLFHVLSLVFSLPSSDVLIHNLCMSLCSFSYHVAMSFPYEPSLVISWVFSCTSLFFFSLFTCPIFSDLLSFSSFFFFQVCRTVASHQSSAYLSEAVQDGEGPPRVSDHSQGYDHHPGLHTGHVHTPPVPRGATLFHVSLNTSSFICVN